MTALRAIETRFKGYRFRSRLEAKWAVFFSMLGLKWEYEPEGFVTSAGPYLPDFRVWTPQGKPMWYEVKPEHIESDEKFEAFAKSMEEADPDRAFRGALLSGDPMAVTQMLGVTVCPRCGVIERSGQIHRHVGAPDDEEFHQYCYSCDLETPSGGGHPIETGILGLDYYPHKGSIVFWTIFFEHIYLVAKRARAARFEHGERG